MLRRKTINSNIIGVFIFCLMLLFPFAGFAQCDPFVDPNCEDPDIQIPLDEWVVVLAVTAGGLGVIKIHNENKKKSPARVKTMG